MAEDTITWIENILPWSLVGLVVWDSPFSPNTLFRSVTIATGVAYLSLYLLASFWQRQVTETVPEPYLVSFYALTENELLILYRMKCFIYHRPKHIV